MAENRETSLAALTLVAGLALFWPKHEAPPPQQPKPRITVVLPPQAAMQDTMMDDEYGDWDDEEDGPFLLVTDDEVYEI